MGDRGQPEYGSPSGEITLQGRTILITRAREQSHEITTQLEALGAVVIHCPTIQVVPPDSWAPLDAAIKRISEYDWIIFTSSNGVRFFFDRIEEMGRDIRVALAGCFICAIGEATARALNAAGCLAQVIASESKAEGVLDAIIENVGSVERVRGIRFLIPRAKVAREVLPVGLRKMGAHVDAVEAYQTTKPDVDREAIVRLFTAQSIDAITFTSSSTVSNFAELVGQRDLGELIGNTLVACIGPVTAETAATHGLKSIIQPESYNASALVDAIVKALERQ